MNSDFDRLPLSSLVDIDKKSLGKKTPSDYEFSYISLSDVSKGQIKKNLERCIFSSAPSRARRVVQTGDILLATVRPNLQGFAKVADSFSDCIASTGFAVLTPKTNVSGEFVYQSLFSHQVKQQIESLVVGSNYPAINSSEVAGIHIYVPPYQEQRKIAKVLSAWDKAITTSEKLIETNKQQKKALMQQLLTGKKRLVNPETGKIFEGEWDRFSMSDLVFIDRKSLGKKTPDDFEFRYISLSDVDVGSISKELEVHKFAGAPSRARRVIQEGDILLSTVRPNLKGFAKVSENHIDCIASTGFCVLTPKKRVSGDYIYQYVFSSHVTGQIESLVVGSNYPAINSSDVAGLKVYCPTYEEQQRIASLLTAADKEIEALEAQLAHFKQEKKALMQQLLTGKRRVKVDEDVAA